MRCGFLKRVFALCLALVLLIPMVAMSEEADISSEWIESAVSELEETALDALPEESVPTGESPEVLFPERSHEAAEDNAGGPQDRQITISGNAYESANIGDTLRVYVSGAGADVSSWKSSKTKIATVSFNGEYATVRALGRGTAKLTAKLSNKKKLTLNLTVTDRYQPSSIAFSESEILLAVGDVCDLKEYIELTPDTARTTYTWKSSSKKIAKVDEYGRVTALKPGNTTITVTTKNKKSDRILIRVLANKMTGLSGKPSRGDYYAVEGGWSLWPVSVEMLSSGALACEFYLLNGTNDKSKQIENLALTLSAGSSENIIAQYFFSTVKISCKKNNCKAFKVTFPASSVRDRSLFLPEYSDALYFDIYDDSRLRMKAGKGNYYFIPTVFPTEKKDRLVKRIELDRDYEIMEPGDTLILTPEIYPDSAVNKGVKWSSSNPSVATVDAGVISAISEGDATIWVMAEDGGGAEDFCEVHVTAGGFEVEMQPDTLRLKVGENANLFAIQNPLATVITGQTWSSSDDSIARVDRVGRVTAIAEGTAQIIASMTSESGVTRKGICEVTVEREPTLLVSAISLGQSRFTIEVGETETLMAAVEPENAENKIVLWRSSNESVARMDHGAITGVSAGQAIVTATAADGGGATAQCVVEVIESPSGITIPGNVIAASGEDGTIVVMWLQATGCDGYRVRYHKKGEEPWASVYAEGSDAWKCTIPADKLKGGGIYEVSVCGTRGIDPFISPEYMEGPDSDLVEVSVGGYVPINSVSLNAPSLIVERGDALNLYAEVRPANASNRNLYWISSDTSVATVTDGVVTGLDTGEVTITAISEENPKISDSVNLTVIPGKDSHTIEPPEKLTLTLSENTVFAIWSKVPDASGYKVYYRREKDIIYQSILITGGDRLAATLPDLDYDTNYFIHVTAFKDNEESGHTADQVVHTPARPMTEKPVIQHLIASGDCVYLSWIRVPGAMCYFVGCREEGAQKAEFTQISLEKPTEYLAMGLKRNVQYEFCVSAVLESGTPEQCDWEAVRTQTSASELLSMTTSVEAVALPLGATYRLDTVLIPQDARYSRREWVSADPSVATVDSTGLIRAMSNGSTMVTVKVTSPSGRVIEARSRVTVKAPEYRALLIGQCTFGSEAENRPMHKEDVARMSKMLSARKGADGSKWQIYSRLDRSSAEVKQDIMDCLGPAEETDVSLFFIATHGDTHRAYEDKSASMLACYNSASYIYPHELAAWLTEVKGKVIVIISACGSGGFIAEPPVGQNAAVSDQMDVYANFDLGDFDQAFVDAFRQSDEGIATVQSNAGDLRDQVTKQSGENKFYVLTASRFQESAFAGKLVGWLTEGVGTSGKMKADTHYAGNSDGYLTLHELYTYISKVGDNSPIISSADNKKHYQHVQVYPSRSDFILLKQ